MPTYEYECQKCSHCFEMFQSMTDERVKRCPKCRGKVVRLIGTGSGIIFKGSGFYETDYRRNTSGGKAEEEKSTSTTVAPKSDSATQGKEKKTEAPATPAKKD